MDFVECPRCGNKVPAVFVNTGELFPCGGCARPTLIDILPAAGARGGGGALPGVVAEGAATCFFHDERAAQAACDGCGRYLCALCDVPVGREHLCPECLALRSSKGRKQSLPNERLVWDRLALFLAFLPLLLWPLTIITAPMVLFIVFRYWSRPGSLVGRAWPRFLLAGLVAFLQLAGWTAAVVALIRS